jgi:site-specific DNA recombinase
MTVPTRVRCAIYTRKSSEEGLEQSFNSLDAQREACEAYVLSQRHEGWQAIATNYDDGGYSGGNMERPALKRLLEDIAARRINTVVVYKVDRLTRSLADFAKIVEAFDRQGISFVSVTQQFNTTTSMGRLTLNVLLSFAQFEREVTGERIRDKIAASKRKGMWMGGVVPIGYELQDRNLVVHLPDAEVVRQIFQMYLKLGCVSRLQEHLEQQGMHSKKRVSRTGRASGGAFYSRGALYGMLQNRIYLGEIVHKGASYPGQHAAIIDQALWDQVQAQFKANLQAERKRPRTTGQSALTGLLYDSEGNRFTPSHANKKGRRYRYYVSQSLIHGRGKGSRGPVRLPAGEIEALISSQLKELLESPQRLLDLLSEPSASQREVQSLLHAVQESGDSTDKAQSLLKSAVARIVVYDEQIEVQIDKRALHHELLGKEVDPPMQSSTEDPTNLLILKTDARLKRCGGEVRFQLAPDSNHAKAHPAPSLIRAVARAHDWVDRILRGELTNQRALAEATGLSERYVSRILPLAFLAPDLTEAILDGKHAAHLSLEVFRGDVPIDWNEQRAQFGGCQNPASFVRRLGT